MKPFQITFANGDIITTQINGDYQDAIKYYLGNLFNIGLVEDNIQKCTKVERLFECEFNGRPVGTFENFKINVWADSRKGAHNKVHDSFEHISNLTIVE